MFVWVTTDLLVALLLFVWVTTDLLVALLLFVWVTTDLLVALLLFDAAVVAAVDGALDEESAGGSDPPPVGVAAVEELRQTPGGSVADP